MKIKSEKNITNLKIIENKNDRYSLIKLEYKLMSTFILSQLNKYIFLLLFRIESLLSKTKFSRIQTNLNKKQTQ